MADKKKMSVAEILAAARKADSQSADAPAAPDAPDAPASAEAPAADSTTSEAPPPKPAKSASGGRPSVAEMLAMARAEKAEGGGEKPAAKPTPQPAAKPAAKKAAPKPAAKAPAAKPAAGPRDTGSILAAARKTTKPGPMSKAEAAALKTGAEKPAKKRVELPPMPVKPAYAQRPSPKKPGPKRAAAGAPERRGFLSIGFVALGAVCVAWAFAATRFMFPNVVREPPSRFKVGFPDAFPPGSVETKFKAQYGVWIVNAEFNGEQQISALKTVCTHLGCTPNWLEAEQKFKCPCHGSGFYKDGINFEGPAPRPLERYAIRIADDGQIEIDKSRIFQEEMGQWTDPSCYIPV